MIQSTERCPHCTEYIENKGQFTLCDECGSLLVRQEGRLLPAWKDLPEAMDALVKEEIQLFSAESTGTKPIRLGSQCMAGFKEIELTRLAKRWHRRDPFARAGNHRGISLGKIVEYAAISRLLSAITEDD